MQEYGQSGATAASIEYFKGYSIHYMKLLMMLFPRIYGENVYEPFGTAYSSGFDIELFLGVFVLLIILFGATRYFTDFRIKLSLGMMVGAFLFQQTRTFHC